MVAIGRSALPKHEKSSSEQAVECEAALRLAINDLPAIPATNEDHLSVLSRIVNELITDDIALNRPILRVMRDHFLDSLSNSTAITASSTSHGGPELQQQQQEENSKESETWPEVRTSVLQCLDTFLSVHVIGARAKASAFFDKLIYDTRWLRIGLVAGSTVAESAFLAVNSWGGSKKSLTVIDLGKSCPGHDVVKRLAFQTQAPVRYAPLCAAHKALEQVDVVIMGAQEVVMNGCAIVAPGGGIVAQAAQEARVPVVITTQSVKFTERIVVDWFVNGGDVLKPAEIHSIVTELDTNSLSPTFAPDILKRMIGGPLL